MGSPRPHLARLNAARTGDLNHNWKGDGVGYAGLHMWVHAHLPRPELCEFCGVAPTKDAANMDGAYTRDLSTWKWLCRSCHFRHDRVAQKAWETKRKRGQ